jgi:hypothetical protein
MTKAVTPAAFATDALTLGDRVTINAGVRFDHSRAIGQGSCRGRSRWTRDRRNYPRPRTLYVERVLAAHGCDREAQCGRAHDSAEQLRPIPQGILTGEMRFHPGAKATRRLISTKRPATTRAT